MKDDGGLRLTRDLFLRLLAFVYVWAFLSLALQVRPLFGENGLLPIVRHLTATPSSFWDRPSLFQLVTPTDALLHGLAWGGVALATAMLVGLGLRRWWTFAILWALYLSYDLVGQLFYGYGWELMLLETGFLAIFLASPAPPSRLAIFLARWLCLRVFLGAGLIKFRTGDDCWAQLTCLYTHFETQPIPNPLSRFLHFLPHAILRGGVVVNHLVEIVAPGLLAMGMLGWRRARLVAGVLFVSFQTILIFSGNLSFLNWLTIAIAIPCFDDRFLSRVLGRRLMRRELPAPSRVQRLAVVGYALVVANLSIEPVQNLLSERQRMNGAYDRFRLVNTYGMFGSVGKTRDEIILQGTSDATVGPDTVWRTYEFPCKPGDPMRRPCVVSPFQPRLDWQIWFAAMQHIAINPWLSRFAEKILQGDPEAKRLLAVDPFPDAPPKLLRGERWRYRFAPLGDAAWWHREYIGPYFYPYAGR